MKRIITILFLLLSISTFAQLSKSVYVDFGYDNTNYFYYQVDNSIIIDKMVYVNKSLFTNIGIDINYKFNNFNFRVFSENKTHIDPIKIYSYRPHLIDFDIGAEINYNNISFIYKHRCTHSIDILSVKGGYDIFFIRYKII